MKKIEVIEEKSVPLDEENRRSVNFTPGKFTVTDEIAEAGIAAGVATLISKKEKYNG